MTKREQHLETALRQLMQAVDSIEHGEDFSKVFQQAELALESKSDAALVRSVYGSHTDENFLMALDVALKIYFYHISDPEAFYADMLQAKPGTLINYFLSDNHPNVGLIRGIAGCQYVRDYECLVDEAILIILDALQE